MPADRPALGEIWTTSVVDGNQSRACVVAIDSERDILLLASPVGRCAPMAIRSLLLTWTFDRASTEAMHLCQARGCQEVAFVRARVAGESPRYVCHRHVPANTAVLFPGDADDAVAPITVAAVTREAFPEALLTECPSCHNREGVGPRQCPRCGARWRAVAPSVTMDRLAAVVADARRLLRREGRDASYVQMPDSVGRLVVMDTSAVPLRNADDEEILISRGAGRGSGPVFSGLPVQYTVEGPVVIVSIAERAPEPEGPRFVRMRDMVAFAETGRNAEGHRILDQLGHLLGTARILVSDERFAEGFRPIDEIVPPTGSYWRDPNRDGSFITVTGHTQPAGSVLHVTFSSDISQNEALPIRAFTQRLVRFDKMELPAIGSRWLQRGGFEPAVVTEVSETNGLTFVVLRNIANSIFRLLLPDLWRNYTDVTPDGDILCDVNEEWTDPDGQCYRVLTVDAALAVATLLRLSDEQRVQHNAGSMKGWSKVERRDIYDRLAGDTLEFGD